MESRGLLFTIYYWTFIERKQEEVILKPVVKLSKLGGIDKLEGASEKIEKIRKEWDEEFENSDC